jgi:dTMP kinase
MNYKYPLICFEGLDASGKATMSAYAAEVLKGIVFSFPCYDSPTGKLLLGHLKGEVEMVGSAPFPPPCRGSKLTDYNMLVRQSLMTVNRYELQARILHALTERPVVLDRYWLSSLVYGEAEGLDTEWIVEISSALLKPDLTIVLDIPVCAVGQRRPQARDKNETDLDKLQRVRDLYRAPNHYTHQNHTVILDADQRLDVIKSVVHNLISYNISTASASTILSGDYNLSPAQDMVARRT